MGGSDRTSWLVGRESERALLRRAIGDAISGRLRTVLIAGEPGIGKTALSEDAADHATAAGARVLWGACWEGVGAPAFWPWVQIVREYAAGRSTAELYEQMGEGAAAIARLVPEIRGRFLSLPAEADVDPEQARFRLFDDICRFLRAAAATQPLVLIFDDLHWADRSSLMLLRFFAQAVRGAGVLLLGTYRDVEITPEHPFHETMADLTAERIALRGLARDDVAALIRDTTGAEPPEGLAEAVFGKTTGNPFFVKEVVRLLDAQGRLGAAPAQYAIPEGVRDVVRRRLAHLSQDEAILLSSASVIGPQFDVDLLGRLVGYPPARVLELLDGSVAARIVLEEGAAGGRYGFAHAIVRDTLYEDLGASQRAALHWRAGELLEEIDRGGARLSEVAHHLVRGANAGDPKKAADVALLAARGSMRIYAWDQAVEQYRRAVDALSLVAAAEPLRVRTMLELGDAQTRAGDLAAARGTYERTADMAASAGLASELAHAALGLGGGLGGFEVRLFDGRQIELLNAALAALPDQDSPVRAWVLARLSVASSFVRSVEERAALAEEAISMARRLGDRGAWSYALSSLCDALSGPDHVAERLAASTEMIELATQPANGAARCGVESCTTCLCDPEFALLGRRLRIVAALEGGDLATVDGDIDAYGRLADHLRQPLYQWYTPLFRGMRSLLRGNFIETARHVAEAEGVAARTSSENAGMLVSVLRFGFALERGDLAEAETTWRSLFEAAGIEELPSFKAMQAVIEGMFGDAASARVLLGESLAEGGLAALDKDSEWIPTAAYTADCAIRLNDRAAAEHVYEALAPYEGQVAVDGIACRMMGSVHHHLGRLAAMLGRTDEAERHLARAVEIHDRMGATLWAERSRGELAALHGAPPAAGAEPGENLFRREGEYWTIAFDGVVARLKDSKGLRDIAALLHDRGREVAALDLMGSEASLGVRAGGDAGELLDERARAEYKARIAELQAEIDDPDAPPGGAARAREELDALATQLSSAYGLGGRARRAGDPAERARKAVTERIRDAIARVGRENAALQRHLRASIRTGTFCSYSPERPVTWGF